MRYREIIEASPRKPTSPTSGTIKPAQPMTPAKGRREADRKANIQQRIRDTRSQFTKKLRDLQGKLGNKP
jgi:hypothetical protein